MKVKYCESCGAPKPSVDEQDYDDEQVYKGGPRSIVIDDIRCRSPMNMDGSFTHIRIDWPDGHEILIHREEAALLRDWLIEVLRLGDEVKA